MAKLNRRSFLSQASQAILAEPVAPLPPVKYVDPSNTKTPFFGKTSTGLNIYTSTWGNDQIMHLLRRTLFGVKKSDLDFFKTSNMSDTVDYLLNVSTTPPLPPVNNYNNGTYTDPDVALGQTWVNAPIGDGTSNSKRIASWKAWWAGLMLNQDRTILEKMTLFWHNHFATETAIVQDARYTYKHHAMLRANCLLNFKSLVRQVTIDPAMLRYLNGYANVKTAPDENYGRELQELFTIGKFLTNRYTEDDVKTAARILTGWKDNKTNINSTFDITKHDTANKQFSSFYNNTVITGRSTSNAGDLELDDMLNMIFAQQEVSKFICRKLYRYFVYYVIDQSVEDNIITPLAKIFRDNNYDIKPVMVTLLKSEHFYDSLNMGCSIKTPIEFTVGMYRQFNAAFPDNSDIVTQYAMWDVPRSYAASMIQDLGDPPNVAGWAAYYQDPQFYELWINSDTLPKRNTLADGMLYTGYKKNNFTLIIDSVAFANQMSNPGDPNSLISDSLTVLYSSAVNVSTTTIAFLKSILLSGQTSDHYWTDAWNLYKADTTNAMNKATITTRLQAMYKYLMDAAEYQLC